MWISKPVEKILKFGNNWFKVFYENGKHMSYPSSEVVITKRMETLRNALEYLNRVVNQLEAQSKSTVLSFQLKNMQLAKGCALIKFLQKSKIENTLNESGIVFPFGSNYSQMEAVKLAFTSDLSVIQGPPGTGKTQTILNILANALLLGKTVAVTSGNNEATNNVAKKMLDEGLSFLTAFLGNSKNTEKFFKERPLIPHKVKEWKGLSKTNWADLNAKTKMIKDVLLFQLELPKIEKQIAELQIEKDFCNKKYQDKGIKLRRSAKKTVKKCTTSKEALRVSAILETASQKTKIGLFTKLSFRFKHGVKLTKRLGDTIDCLQNKYYDLKLAELKAELKEKEEIVKSFGTELLKNEIAELGKKALFKSIGEKYSSDNQDDLKIDEENYRNNMLDFTKRYPIVFSTTNALQKCTGKGFLYDYLIIDESSQVNIVTACIALACAKNVVLVGDKMQLPHIVKSRDKEILEKIFAEYTLPGEMEYSKYSILDAVTKMYDKSGLPSTLLNEHYQCDPHIIGFCNKRFYGDSLIVQTLHKVML
jgi:superfamily I DNA and/or RNA helicase